MFDAGVNLIQRVTSLGAIESIMQPIFHSHYNSVEHVTKHR
jgi:hypothetical protein